MKQLIYVMLLTAFSSCGSVRTLEGRAKPVYLSVDTSLFSDSLYPVQSVYFPILKGLQGGFVSKAELQNGKATKAYIHRPTIFHKDGQENTALLYPREHIQLSGSDYDYNYTAVNGNVQRNRELQFFKTFYQLEKRPPEVPRILDYTLQTILDFEKEQRNAIPKAEALSQAIFDSLLIAYDVSDKFRKLTKNYVHHRYDLNLNWVYKLYKDTLVAHGLYFEKFRQLIPSINSITENEKFNANVQTVVNDIRMELFPMHSMQCMDENIFRDCFDSVENNFKGLAREYLLSRTMYRAYAIGLKVPKEYEEKYRRYCMNKDYRRIVRNTKRQPQRQHRKDKKVEQNILLAPDGKIELQMEKVLAQHKGKFVFMDLWASWCLPCIEEMPYLKQLRETYPQDKIVFLTISLDKSISSWIESMFKRAMQTENSYLLLNHEKTSFFKHYKINEIPRFLLFDKEGHIIDDHAPAPSDPVLRDLLNKLVVE